MSSIIRLTPAGPVSFKRRSLEPATEFYVTADDVIRFGVRCSTTPTVTFRARIQQPDGTVAVFERTQVVADETDHIVEFRLIEGFLLGASISTAGTLLFTGQCYAWANLISVGAGDLVPSRALLGGYIERGFALGWPETPIQPPASGPGFVERFDVANPAAGAEVSFENPFNRRARFIGCFASLTTDGTTADRRVGWQVRDIGANMYLVRCVDVQAASLEIRYTFAVAAGDGAIHGNAALLPAPSISRLDTFTTIGSSTQNLQAGDQWENFRLMIEWWVIPSSI